MHQYTQGLLALGTLAILAALAIPNLKAFAIGSVNLVRSPEKHPAIDKSRAKRYVTCVVGLTLLCGLYNLAITRNFKLLGEATGIDCLILAAGLQTVVLYKKKDEPRK